MPSRWMCGLIIAFWLATTGWLIRREIAPHWFADAPPSVVIELVDEAVRQPLPVTWRLYRNGVFAAAVRTVIEYREADDTFSLISKLFQLKIMQAPLAVTVNELSTTQRIDRAGKLLGIETTARLDIQGTQFDAKLAGAVVDHHFRPMCEVKSPFGRFRPSLEAVPISDTGTLNPLHPVNRLPKLRVGQTWRQSVSDPLADAIRHSLAAYARKEHAADLGSILGASAPTTLLAEVTGPRLLDRGKHAFECWVIEYRGDGFQAQTWVRTIDGLVMQQEASAAGETWRLERE